jgi:DNA-binding transcriptional LysR family regulator
MIDGEFSKRRWLTTNQLLHCRSNLAIEPGVPDPSMQFRQAFREIRIGAGSALLGVSQPPLSKSFKNLEDELGTPLLVRTRRHVELTPVGQALLTCC